MELELPTVETALSREFIVQLNKPRGIIFFRVRSSLTDTGISSRMTIEELDDLIVLLSYARKELEDDKTGTVP